MAVMDTPTRHHNFFEPKHYERSSTEDSDVFSCVVDHLTASTGQHTEALYSDVILLTYGKHGGEKSETVGPNGEGRYEVFSKGPLATQFSANYDLKARWKQSVLEFIDREKNANILLQTEEATVIEKPAVINKRRISSDGGPTEEGEGVSDVRSNIDIHVQSPFDDRPVMEREPSLGSAMLACTTLMSATFPTLHTLPRVLDPGSEAATGSGELLYHSSSALMISNETSASSTMRGRSSVLKIGLKRRRSSTQKTVSFEDDTSLAVKRAEAKLAADCTSSSGQPNSDHEAGKVTAEEGESNNNDRGKNAESQLDRPVEIQSSKPLLNRPGLLSTLKVARGQKSFWVGGFSQQAHTTRAITRPLVAIAAKRTRAVISTSTDEATKKSSSDVQTSQNKLPTAGQRTAGNLLTETKATTASTLAMHSPNKIQDLIANPSGLTMKKLSSDEFRKVLNNVPSQSRRSDSNGLTNDSVIDRFRCSVCQKTHLNRRALVSHLHKAHAPGNGDNGANDSNDKGEGTDKTEEDLIEKDQFKATYRDLARAQPAADRISPMRPKHEGFRCQLCPAIRLNLKQLRAHAVSEHGAHRVRDALGKVGKITYKCRECSSEFNRRKNFTDHVAVIHRRQHAHVCRECGKCFGRVRALQEHELIHKNGGEALRCPICSLMMTRKTYLQQHMASKHDVSPSQFALYGLGNRTEDGDSSKDVARPLLCERCGK